MSVHRLKHPFEDYELILDDCDDWVVDRISGIYVHYKIGLIGVLMACANKGIRASGSWPIGRAVLEAHGKPRPSHKHQVMHLNDNPLDNRLANLRWGTKAENDWMKGPQRARSCMSSKYKGVNWRKDVGKWEARVHWRGRWCRAGLFVNDEDAARAYDKMVREFRDQSEDPIPKTAYTNFPIEGDWRWIQKKETTSVTPQ